MTNTPLVTIGIPTRNRAHLLRRALESAVAQDYPNLEIIVSDNASTDDTSEVARSFKVKYVRYSENVGPVANFNTVRRLASGEFFMWLADDDWIDPGYVSACVKRLVEDPSLSLVAGKGRYDHLNDVNRSFLQENWWTRVLSYYRSVRQNTLFYGVSRYASDLPNSLAGDWLVVATALGRGKALVLNEVTVHCQSGGTSTSYISIVRALKLPEWEARFARTVIARNAALHLLQNPRAYGSNVLVCALLAPVVFAALLLRHVNLRVLYWRLRSM